MKTRTLALPAAAVLFAVLAIAGCKKKEAEAPVVATPATVPAPLPPPATIPGGPIEMPQGEAAARVDSIELGSAVGPDRRVTAAKSTFAPRDKIIVAVSTQTTDVAATVPSRLGAKWTHVGSNQVVNEENRDVELKGSQVWDFEITNPDPWPTGKYRIEVALDGNVVSARTFEVK